MSNYIVNALSDVPVSTASFGYRWGLQAAYAGGPPAVGLGRSAACWTVSFPKLLFSDTQVYSTWALLDIIFKYSRVWDMKLRRRLCPDVSNEAPRE